MSTLRAVLSAASLLALTVCAAPAATTQHIDLRNIAASSTPRALEDLTLGSNGGDESNVHSTILDNRNIDPPSVPTTDHGAMPNLKWPFSMSHTRFSEGGWAREQNIDVLPAATALAAVNMYLEVGAVRELHWHSTAEWAYMLKGDVRITTMTPKGQVFVGDVSAGDLWYFPAGSPHSIQAKNTTEGGAEFLLIFDSGAFSEDATFLLTDWLSHVPKSVLAKNFGLQDPSVLDNIPEKELYIFSSPAPTADPELDMVIPNNVENPYTYPLSKIEPTRKLGGSVKVIDSKAFKVAQKISAVEVTVDVGGMRELHWHPTQPEWTFFVSGDARVTVFASSTNAHTYNFTAGDAGYIPPSYGHYVENIGNTTLKFLEVFQSDVFEDVSLTQWLALTPHKLVEAHLGIPSELISKFSRVKQTVVS